MGLALCAAAGRSVAAPAAEGADGWLVGSNAASHGGFGVIQNATSNRAQLLAAWRKPTPGVDLHVTTRAHRG